MFKIPEEDEIIAKKGTPERTLLAAILELAVRDLGPSGTYLNKRQAVSWFNSDSEFDTKRHLWFSFKQICIELDLTREQVKYIAEKVEIAEQKLTQERAAKQENETKKELDFISKAERALSVVKAA